MRPLHPLIIKKENQNAAQSQISTMQQQEMQSATGHAGMSNRAQADCLSSVIVPRTASTRDITVLETAMQGLALDDRHPVALELAATATSRQFLLRATSPLALRHLEDQVRARYPQSLISSVPEQDDPLIPRDLALVPVPPTWSRHYRRKSVEHPLEQERLRARLEGSGTRTTGPSNLQLIGMGVLVAVLLLWLRFKRQLDGLVPFWLRQAVLSLLHGKTPSLSPSQLLSVEIAGSLAVVALFCLAFVVLQIRNHLGTTPIYDMRLVDEKTARLAYRVRLRLFVFSSERGTTALQRVGHMRLLQSGLTRQPSTWSSLRDVYASWRGMMRHNELRRQEHSAVLAHLVAAYRQYHTASGGYFLPRRLSQAKIRSLLSARRKWLTVHRTGWSHDLRRSRHLLSVSDIAALWHLPQAQDLADLPYVERARARTALAPAALIQGDGWKIGISHHAGHTIPVYLPDDCLHHNLLAVASTGKGKSTLFMHLAQAVCAMRANTDSERRPGLAFIEPHGDVVHALCGLVPASERDNVVLVDLASTDYPVGINPLDMVGKDRDKVVDNFITIAEHLWVASYGSRTENVLEYALKTLADANEWLIATDPYAGPDRQYTLLDVVPLLRATSFRHAVLEQVRDSLLLGWWQHYYEPMDAHQQREITSSVITKLSKFASSRVARRILGQPRSTIDLREVVRSGQLLLVSTASGVVGTDLSELVGIVLLGLFEAALAEQAALPPEQRRRYLVLIDEFQVYRGANYRSMLAELRKYGGSFALATQSLAYLDQLDRTLRATVLANIDHLFAFHMAGEDARLLHELDGIMVEDVTNLDDFQCYVKLSLHGQRLPVFSLHLDEPPHPDEEVAQMVHLRSRQRDTRPAGVVDELLRHMQARQQSAAPTKPKAAGSRASENTVAGAETTGEGTGSARRQKKKRGSGARTRETKEAPPSHLHLMYREDNEEGPPHIHEEMDGDDSSA